MKFYLRASKTNTYQPRNSRVQQPMFRAVLLYMAFWSALGMQAQVGEIGVTAGAMYYIGDLNPYRHYPKDTKFAYGVLYRYNFSDRYALRLQALNGTLQSYDSHSSDSLQQLRNLHFRARLLEFSGLFEVNFRKYRSRDKDSKKWTPFIFGGLAYFRANPQAQLDDTWYDLAPLGTEGQGTSAKPDEDAYAVDHMCIPFGAGFKVNLGRLDFQLEWGLRRTYTDYVDDVSTTYVDRDQLAFENGPLAAALADPSVLAQLEEYPNEARARGDQNTRDWYQYTGLAVTYIITKFSDCDEQYNWMRKRR